MERSFIEYNGAKYPTIEISLSKISDIESDEIVTIADYELWSVIEDDYEEGVKDAVWLDDKIYYYCDSGFIASNPTEDEVIEYMNKNC